MSSASLHEVPLPKTAPAGGAAEAAASLYERYHDRVYGFCLYQLGNREEAEDATQTTFLSALRALERGVVPQMEANWLFTIARNTCRGRFRTRGLARERETLSDPHLLEGVAPAHEAAGDQLFSLEDALADMPEQQRRAIILREWRGCSYAEIADELELSAPAVETLIFRARRSLAQRLEHPPIPAKRAGILSGFGSLFTGLKASLGLGTAAKAGLAVSAAVVAIGIGVPSDVPQRPMHTPPAVDLPLTTPVATAPSAGVFSPDEKGPKIHPPTKSKPAPTKPKQQPGQPVTGPVGGVLDPIVGGGTGIIDPERPVGSIVDTVNGTVGGVTDTVDDVVDDVVDGVNPLLPPELQLPDIDLPPLGL